MSAAYIRNLQGQFQVNPTRVAPRMAAAASLFLAAASWQPAPLARVQPLTRAQSQRTPLVEIVRAQRAAPVEMVLPKAVAAVFFVPWAFVIVTNNLPEEQRLKIQKSPMLQGGIKMKTMKTKKPPAKVKGVRLTPEVLEVTRGFKKEYPTKELESLWGALLKCYGTKERALAAVRTNPQVS